MPGYIHHVEWCVRDAIGQASILIEHYGFEVIAERTTKTAVQIVVQSGKTNFIVTQKVQNPEITSEVKAKDYPVLSCCETNHERDTVFNVALVVGDKLNEIVDKIKEMDGSANVLVWPRDLGDDEGQVSVVKSCCGNVIHTLLSTEPPSDSRNSSGFSLPGFTSVQKNGLASRGWNANLPKTTHMDHVTYVCQSGDSKEILNWYNRIFKMRRFLVGPQEKLEDDGIEIGNEVGMRLTVGEWLSSWMCREEGAQFDQESEVLNFKLVLAEPLDNDSDSHVQKFLDHHGGPGLQHIGLTSPNVTETVQIMTNYGAHFRKPPPTYYQLSSKRKEIATAGEDLELCSRLGLLFDSEADTEEVESEREKFLVQIFTKPMFGSQDTFFLEILERRGARGFGAGNITALAQSIILYQKQQEQQRQHEITAKS